MEKLVERIHGKATLTLDGVRKLPVAYDISVYQEYLVSDAFGSKGYDSAGLNLKGVVTPGNIGLAVQCGQETNVLDLGAGRKIDINPPVLLQRFQGFGFSVHDEMNFFDTPLYRRLE